MCFYLSFFIIFIYITDASPSDMLDAKIKCLKGVIHRILCNHGGKVKRSELWSLVAQEQGRAVIASEYGVSNIYDVLTLMSDILSEVMDFNTPYVKLNTMPKHIHFQDDQSTSMFSHDFPTLSESMNPVIPPLSEVSDTLMKCLCEYPDGIELDKLWDFYRQKTGKPPPRPEHYKILKECDFFKLPEFRNFNQFTRYGKAWLRLKSWDDLNQHESGGYFASGSRDTPKGALCKMWGTPAESDFQKGFQQNVSQSLLVNMRQMMVGASASTSSQQKANDEVEDSLYLSKKPILPAVNVKKKQVMVTPINLPRGRQLNKEQLDSIAKECIEIISDAQDYVSNEGIEKLMLRRLNRNRLHEIGLRDIDQLKSVFEHNRLSCKVNAYIQAFVKVRSICTLRELEESICDYIITGGKFESLKLGPLHRLPMVFDMFKYPVEEDEFPEIHTMDIMQKIREFLTVKNKWTEKLNMEEVMTYLIEAYEVSTPYHLGIRIRSLPLVVGVSFYCYILFAVIE